MGEARTLARRMFRRWIRYEPRFTEFLDSLPGIVIGMYFLSFAGLLVAKLLLPIGEMAGKADLEQFFVQNSLPVVAAILLLAVMIEEAVFRLPLIVPLQFFGPGRVTILTVVALSVVFGEAHGSWHFMVQGMGGLVLSLVFLKCGAVRGRWGYLKGYTCAVLAHYAFNMTTIIPVYVLRWFGISFGS